MLASRRCSGPKSSTGLEPDRKVDDSSHEMSATSREGDAGFEAWPELPYSTWKDTLETLHMNVQIVGKVRLALSPFEPQWAEVPLYLTARGLTTTPMQFADLIFQIDVDLVEHQV